MSDETIDMLHDAVSRLLTDHCRHDVLAACETGGWPSELWLALKDSGLIHADVVDMRESSLLEWPMLAVLFQLAGEYGTPVPWVETLLAQRHLKLAGLQCVDGPLSIAPSSPFTYPPTLTRHPDHWQLNGKLTRVPWGSSARALVIAATFDQQMALVRLDACDWTELGFNEAHEPRDTLRLEGVRVARDAVSLAYAPVNSLALEAALARSLQMVGAMRKVLALTLEYSKQRVQFGRPIAKFQAVQHLVAVQASHTAAANAAATAAMFAASQASAAFEIAAAKARVSEAAGLSARTAHQVHGAMGITKEYPLHFWTRRLFAWRDEFGSEVQWAQALGRLVIDAGSENLWPLVSDPREHQDQMLQFLRQEVA